MIVQTQFDFAPASELRQRGELLKLRGMELAASKRAAEVATGQADFLRALLHSPTGICTMDDSTADLSASFADGGKWRGAVVRGLAMAGIIQRVGVVQSDRPSRHRGLLARWRLVDREKAIQWLRAFNGPEGEKKR